MSDPGRGDGDVPDDSSAAPSTSDATAPEDRASEAADPDSADEGTDPADADAGSNPEAEREDVEAEREDVEALRERVEAEYDFDSFGPSDMAEMEPQEWEAAFDADSWITGEALLDRVEADLKHRIATRDVFAVVERVTREGRPCLLAYTDSGYALVEPDGSVEGFGTVLRDAKPVVALCSMESYDVPEPPAEDFLLPHPEEVPEESNELGNVMMQAVAGVFLLSGVVIFLSGLYLGLTSFLSAPALGPASGASGSAAVIAIVVGFVFLVVGLALFATVANARLSDAFRSEEYRDRLRSMGLDDGERPDFLPVTDGSADAPDEHTGDE